MLCSPDAYRQCGELAQHTYISSLIQGTHLYTCAQPPPPSQEMGVMPCRVSQSPSWLLVSLCTCSGNSGLTVCMTLQSLCTPGSPGDQLAADVNTHSCVL